MGGQVRSGDQLLVLATSIWTTDDMQRGHTASYRITRA